MGPLGLRLGVYPPSQLLQTDGRLCHSAPASHVAAGIAGQQGPFAPRALPRFLATTSPSATLSSSADFPGSPVIRPTWLRSLLGGTRRASPVARRVLVTVLSLPPRRSASSLRPDCADACGLRPPVVGSASRASHFRGHLCVHSRYGPVTRSPPSRWLCRWASGHRFRSSLPSWLRGFWLLPRRDSFPAERASLRWTHNRTCGFPASGSRTDFTRGIQRRRLCSSSTPRLRCTS
jgi:hypothetical protein